MQVDAPEIEQNIGQEVAQKLQSHQIFALIFVSAIGLAVIGLSIWEFKSIIGLEYRGIGSAALVSSSEATTASDEDLKKRDTDVDGLSDYDELKVYLTSPYLKDSDSDGYDDKVEVDSGNDPNCPKGQTCESTEESKAAADAGAGLSIDFSDLANASPSQVRQALISTGVFTEADLQGVGDDELMKMYKEALGGAGGSLTNTSDGKAISSVSDLKTQLKNAGISEELLNGVDDATLKQLYEDALKEASGQ